MCESLFACLMQYNPKESKVLGVFGLSLYTGEKDLREIFCKYGSIDRVQVVYDHQVIDWWVWFDRALCLKIIFI